ncbi:hypothetical protein BDR05DRAFT_187218 [Suillus weaverae]|nr:hypothetical protein BDR05DRAFT_187218 [Suillus weaverae]
MVSSHNCRPRHQTCDSFSNCKSDANSSTPRRRVPNLLKLYVEASFALMLNTSVAVTNVERGYTECCLATPAFCANPYATHLRWQRTGHFLMFVCARPGALHDMTWQSLYLGSLVHFDTKPGGPITCETLWVSSIVFFFTVFKPSALMVATIGAELNSMDLPNFGASSCPGSY